MNSNFGSIWSFGLWCLSAVVFCFSGVAHGIVAASTDPGASTREENPFFLEHKATETLFMGALERIASFADSPCVKPDSKAKIKAHMKATVNALLGQQKEGLEYLLELSQPMKGEGTCNGGFAAVAAETGRRIDRTDRSIAKNEALDNDFGNSFQQVLTNGKFGIDGTRSLSCATDAVKLIDTMNADGQALRAQFGRIRKSLEFERRRLKDFQDQNLDLVARCGRHDYQDPRDMEAKFQAMKDTYAKLANVHKRPELYQGDITGVKLAQANAEAGRKWLENPLQGTAGKPGAGKSDRQLSDISGRSEKLSADREILEASGARAGREGNSGAGKENLEPARAEIQALLGEEKPVSAAAGAEKESKEKEREQGTPASVVLQTPTGKNAKPANDEAEGSTPAQSEVLAIGVREPASAGEADEESLFARVHRCYQRNDPH